MGQARVFYCCVDMPLEPWSVGGSSAQINWPISLTAAACHSGSTGPSTLLFQAGKGRQCGGVSTLHLFRGTFYATLNQLLPVERGAALAVSTGSCVKPYLDGTTVITA